MTAGKLSAAKPAATTNTTLYRCPITKAASTVLEVCNQSSTASSYRVALRDYDQILTMDSSNYNFRRGNIITNYSLRIVPGVNATLITSGETVNLSDNKGSFKYADVNVPTEIIEYDVKVVAIANVGITVPLGSDNDIVAGDIITGADTGLTAVVYASGTTSLTLQIDDILSTDTSIITSTTTGLAVNDFICFNGEIAQIDAITGNTLTVDRAEIGTTAIAHTAGRSYTAIRETLTTTTLSAAAVIADTTISVTSATSLNIGTYLRIGNELLQVSSINANDVTVIRGQLGTTAVNHSNGATVTVYDIAQVGGYVQFFGLTEEVSNAASDTVTINATATPGAIFNPVENFVYDTGTGVYRSFDNINFDIGRVVRFYQEDSSNTDYALKFSTTAGGTNSPGGLEFLSGVTVNGVAGSSGSYVQIELFPENLLTTFQLYTYVDGETGYGSTITISQNPLYTEIFVYSVDGSPQVNDSFSYENVNYTIVGVNSGSSGYVMSSSGTDIKISLDLNSTSFSNRSTSITGVSGQSTIVVGSAVGLVPSMLVSGTGIATGARIKSIVGTTVTLSLANTNTVSGSGTFAYAFLDSPRVPNSVRQLATVSSVSSINSEDYIFYDRALEANATHRNTGLVVGPGQSIMVYSTNNTINYVAQGFEDTTTDFTPIYYTRETETTP
jgi:hypothetical protein